MFVTPAQPVRVVPVALSPPLPAMYSIDTGWSLARSLSILAAPVGIKTAVPAGVLPNATFAAPAPAPAGLTSELIALTPSWQERHALVIPPTGGIIGVVPPIVVPYRVKVGAGVGVALFQSGLLSTLAW